MEATVHSGIAQTRINAKNDVMWALDVNYIPPEVLYNKCPRKPQCGDAFIAIARR